MEWNRDQTSDNKQIEVEFLTTQVVRRPVLLVALPVLNDVRRRRLGAVFDALPSSIGRLLGHPDLVQRSLDQLQHRAELTLNLARLFSATELDEGSVQLKGGSIVEFDGF